MSKAGKYSFQVWIGESMLADISDIAVNREFILTRNDADQIQFDLNIDALNDYCAKTSTNVQQLLELGVAQIRVVKQGIVLTAGYLDRWDATLENTRMITCYVQGWLELFKFRLTSDSFTSQTANYIARQIVANSLNQTYGTFGLYNGIVLGTQPAVDTTNLYPSKTYDHKTIYDALIELSSEELGFDFEITWDKRLNTYYPIMGVQRPDIVLSYPGNVKNIKIASETSKMVNSLLARGAGYGVNQFTETLTDIPSRDLYGLRQATKDYSDITDTTQLTNLGTSELNTYKNPFSLCEVVLDGNQYPQTGSYHLGDQVFVTVSQLNLYDTLNKYLTIDKIDVKINEDDSEDVTLSLNSLLNI